MSSFTHSSLLNFRTHGTFVILSSTSEPFIHLLSDPQKSPSRVSGFSRTKLHWYDQRVWKVDCSQLCSTACQWICCDLQLRPQAPLPSAPRSHHWQTHQMFCTKVIITRISVDLYMSMIKCRGKWNSCIWSLMPSQAQCWETIGSMHLKSGWHTFTNNETPVTFSLSFFTLSVCQSPSEQQKWKVSQHRYIHTLQNRTAQIYIHTLQNNHVHKIKNLHLTSTKQKQQWKSIQQKAETGESKRITKKTAQLLHWSYFRQ